MDEQAITRAAEEAVSDLQLDCQVKDVCRSSGGDEWCIQFSGKHGHFCDEFKDQFGKENSSRLIREKIKSHLLKQVTKIRSSTGKARRPKANATDERSTQSTVTSAPLEMIGEVFNRASQIAGAVVQQAAGVVDAARETVSNIAENIGPVTVEIRSVSRAEKMKPSRTAARKRVKRAKATSGKKTKTARSVSRQSGKQTKKAGGKSKKAVKKRTKKGQAEKKR